MIFTQTHMRKHNETNYMRKKRAYMGLLSRFAIHIGNEGEISFVSFFSVSSPLYFSFYSRENPIQKYHS